MGLDLGDRRIGVALSDPTGTIASPVTVITRRDLNRDVEAIRALAQSEQVEAFVLGLPIGMRGAGGAQAAAVRAFGDEMAKVIALPLRYQDERLTSVSAERALIESGMRRERRREKIDAVAAAILLQAYLDGQRRVHR